MTRLESALRALAGELSRLQLRSVAWCAVVPLGWPLGRYGPSRRRPVEEVLSVEHYGNREFLATRAGVR